MLNELLITFLWFGLPQDVNALADHEKTMRLCIRSLLPMRTFTGAVCDDISLSVSRWLTDGNCAVDWHFGNLFGGCLTFGHVDSPYGHS